MPWNSGFSKVYRLVWSRCDASKRAAIKPTCFKQQWPLRTWVPLLGFPLHWARIKNAEASWDAVTGTWGSLLFRSQAGLIFSPLLIAADSIGALSALPALNRSTLGPLRQRPGKKAGSLAGSGLGFSPPAILCNHAVYSTVTIRRRERSTWSSRPGLPWQLTGNLAARWSRFNYIS